MRFSAHSKRGGLVLLLVLVTLVSGFLLNGLVFRGHSTHAAGTSSAFSGVTKGIVQPAAIAKIPGTNQSLDSGASFLRGVHHMHRSSQAALAANAVPAVTSTSVADTTPGLLENFNGVSSRDSGNTNFGAEFEPPDQGLCAGNGFVIEPVNSAFTIYRTNGSVVAGPFNVNVLFAEGLKQFTSDPRCYFDKSTNTWFAIILFINATNTEGRTDLAVNTSGDPTTPWTVYHLDATDDGSHGTPSHPGCPCFGDQPRLGIDQQNFYISTDEFSILGPQFNGGQIYAVSKSDLVALSHSTHFVHFENLQSGGALALAVEPAIATGASNAGYFLNSIDPTATFGNRLGVWAITNREAVTQGGIPTLSTVVIASERYGVPPGAIQKGASSLLDAGDDRMQQAQFINGHLWGALDTAVTISHDSAERAGAAWFEVHPQFNGNGTLGATVVNQGYVASSGDYLLYPAIQASPQGTVAIVMTLSAQNFFASVVYTMLQEGSKAFGALHIAAHGTGPYDPKATRWGDYSWATLASDGRSFWMATEYMPPKSSQTVDGLRNWGTRVIQVSAVN